ncbi:MAG: hypothetical protein ACKO3C_01410, partial [Betaproteobacteria bacterium]
LAQKARKSVVAVLRKPLVKSTAFAVAHRHPPFEALKCPRFPALGPSRRAQGGSSSAAARILRAQIA